MTGKDTIAAIATPPGVGGVGVIRISGPLCQDLAQALLGKLPEPRRASLCDFRDAKGECLDSGIALYFPAPHSFTGEDVLELQGHGGPVVLDMLLQAIIQQGARLAAAGEFSQRAFLNGKMDLLQAEAVADLIASRSEAAARGALRSLQGVFSRQIQQLLQQLIQLRCYIEAALDFPEEEVDFLSDGKVSLELAGIMGHTQEILARAKQGQVINEGLRLAIVGEPNVGKSSLLNHLAQDDVAIVTDIPGTTRDVLRQGVKVHGIPFTLVDTAGLRHAQDAVEQEGIRRAWGEMQQADIILYLVDATKPLQAQLKHRGEIAEDKILAIVHNKIDLSGDSPHYDPQTRQLYISVKKSLGMDLLQDFLRQAAGLEQPEGLFTARRRHLHALEQTLEHVQRAQGQAGELMAQELRWAQEQLSRITGEFTSDDLLGEIFASFCIGK